MANRFSSTVRPDDEPRRDPTRFGREIGNAFEDYRRDKREMTLQAREDEEYEANTPLRGLRRTAAEVEAEEYLRDTRGYVPQDQTSGTMPQRPGAVSFDPSMARDIFAQERVGLARTAGRDPVKPGAYVGTPGGRPPQESPGVLALPGQFLGGDFAPGVIREPQVAEVAGRSYRVDPSQTAEARADAEEAEARARQEEQFQTQVRELIAAGVPPTEAAAVARQGLASSYLPGSEPVTYDPEQGIFPSEEARQAFLDYKAALSRAEDAGPMARTRYQEGARTARAEAEARGGGGDEDPPISVEDAYDRLLELYRGPPTGRLGEGELLLSEAQLIDLANKWSSGQITEAELPRKEELMPEEPVVADEPGPFRRFGRWVSDAFTGEREERGIGRGGGSRAGAGATRDGGDPRLQASVDSARQVVREFPGLPESQIRTIMEEEGFDPAVIDLVFQGR